jgi:hypothetical protein
MVFLDLVPMCAVIYNVSLPQTLIAGPLNFQFQKEVLLFPYVLQFNHLLHRLPIEFVSESLPCAKLTSDHLLSQYSDIAMGFHIHGNVGAFDFQSMKSDNKALLEMASSYSIEYLS